MEYNNLKMKVIKQLNIDDEDELKQTFTDITNNQHGASGGFNGFIYYGDTCKFAQDNIKDIFDYAYEQAEQLGEGVYKMISNFNCLNDMNVKETEVASTIHLASNFASDGALVLLSDIFKSKRFLCGNNSSNFSLIPWSFCCGVSAPFLFTLFII